MSEALLVDWQLKLAFKNQEIIIDPFDENLLNANSYDIRLGDSYGEIKPVSEDSPIDPLDKSTFTTEYFNSSKRVLQPKEFVLASMLEHVILSPRIFAEIRGKSSTGRLGIMNSSVAGVIDSGWQGQLVMELFNYSNYPIALTKGLKIGQLIFHRVEQPTRAYGQRGRYQNQTHEFGSKGV